MEGIKDVKSDSSLGDETKKGVVFIDLPLMITLLVPMDKTSANVAFVYQRHNAHVLINYHGLNSVNIITSTYMKAIKPVEKSVSDNTSFL